MQPWPMSPTVIRSLGGVGCSPPGPHDGTIAAAPMAATRFRHSRRPNNPSMSFIRHFPFAIRLRSIEARSAFRFTTATSSVSRVPARS